MRFTIKRMMFAVVVVAICLGMLRVVIAIARDLDSMANYNRGPHEFRLSIGQPVVIYSEDGTSVVAARDSFSYGLIPVLIPPGTRCTVVDEIVGGDIDDDTSYRKVGVRLDEGSFKGEIWYASREDLRVK